MVIPTMVIPWLQTLALYRELLGLEAKLVIADRGYRGRKQIGKTKVIIPGKGKKTDSADH